MWKIKVDAWKFYYKAIAGNITNRKKNISIFLQIEYFTQKNKNNSNMSKI